MTRRLVKLKKSAKEVVLLKTPEETVQVRTVQAQPSVEESMYEPLDNSIRESSLKEGILIGPQEFDPGVEKLNTLKGEIEIKPGPSKNVTIDKNNNDIIIDTKDTGVLSFNNRKGNIILKTPEESKIKINEGPNGTFTIDETSQSNVVTSIAPPNGTQKTGDIILENGSQIKIEQGSTENAIKISTDIGSVVKSFSVNGGSSVGPDVNSNFNFVKGDNIDIIAQQGTIKISVAGGTTIVDFNPLKSDFETDWSISQKATVKDLRDAVNRIIHALYSFYNTNK